MHTGARYVLLALGLIISLHYILTLTHEPYSRLTSLSNIKDKIIPPSSPSRPATHPGSPNIPRRHIRN
ncbi:hypothetical protein BDQ17DRAFT_548040 [Cyathus striatus]|nr:hypothetical protein BDQ17DRAFT_548040 [Cyathus striatus]